METIFDLLTAFRPTAIVWGFSLSLMTALEFMMPRDRYPASGRIAGAMFWTLWLAATAAALALFHRLWEALGIRPLVVLPTDAAWAGPLAGVIAPLLGAVVYDFFFYWCHRAQHRWLWKFHAAHHSITELSAVNAFHHISEPLVQIALIAIPSSLIAADTSVALPAVLILLQLQNTYIHSPSTIHLGPLRRLLVDNRFHRIHHSVERRHFDHNFGAMTTLWDQLFGTAWMPAGNEWPDTGIAEIGQPRTLRSWVMLPADYTAAKRAAKAGAGARPTTAP